MNATTTTDTEYQIGDIVKVNAPLEEDHGTVGTVVAVRPNGMVLIATADCPSVAYHPADLVVVGDTEYQIGQLVELHAEVCTCPCEPDCGCREMVALNGHQGEVLAVQPPMFDGEPYYRVAGLDFIVYGTELRAVQP